MKNFCAVPSLDKFPELENKKIPGEIIFGDGNITLNHGRKAVILRVVNTGDRPVQVFAFNLSFLISVGCFFFLFRLHLSYLVSNYLLNCDQLPIIFTCNIRI